MLRTVGVRGYRSLREVVLALGRLTVITGANGTGKSSVYRALRSRISARRNWPAVARSTRRYGTGVKR